MKRNFPLFFCLAIVVLAQGRCSDAAQPSGRLSDEAAAAISACGGHVTVTQDGSIHVSMKGRRVHDRDLNVLKSLTEVVYLDLSDSAITDAAADELTRITGIKYLKLGSTHISNDFIARFTAPKTLETLDLTATRVTDDAVAKLRAIATLRTLTLTGPGVSADAVREFRRARPDVDVVYRWLLHISGSDNRLILTLPGVKIICDSVGIDNGHVARLALDISGKENGKTSCTTLSSVQYSQEWDRKADVWKYSVGPYHCQLTNKLRDLVVGCQHFTLPLGKTLLIDAHNEARVDPRRLMINEDSSAFSAAPADSAAELHGNEVIQQSSGTQQPKALVTFRGSYEGKWALNIVTLPEREGFETRSENEYLSIFRPNSEMFRSEPQAFGREAFAATNSRPRKGPWGTTLVFDAIPAEIGKEMRAIANLASEEKAKYSFKQGTFRAERTDDEAHSQGVLASDEMYSLVCDYADSVASIDIRHTRTIGAAPATRQMFRIEFHDCGSNLRVRTFRPDLHDAGHDTMIRDKTAKLTGKQQTIHITYHGDVAISGDNDRPAINHD